VADDDKITTEMYKIVLEARGHSVVSTNDGYECRETYKATRPYDAVVLDYRLPLLDGLQVAKEILEMDGSQRIVFVTAYGTQILADLVTHLKRVVELLMKPFDPDLLVDLIEDKSSLAKLRDLNNSSREIFFRKTPPSWTEIDTLLQQLRTIQKPDTI
jgi:DNA-binding NtrC family response regulator